MMAEPILQLRLKNTMILESDQSMYDDAYACIEWRCSIRNSAHDFKREQAKTRYTAAKTSQTRAAEIIKQDLKRNSNRHRPRDIG